MITKKEREIEFVSITIKEIMKSCRELIAKKEILQEATKTINNMAEFAGSTFPIIGAAGIDAENAEIHASIKAQRMNALLNLVTTIEDTEKELIKHNTSRAVARRELNKILGM